MAALSICPVAAERMGLTPDLAGPCPIRAEHLTAIGFNCDPKPLDALPMVSAVMDSGRPPVPLLWQLPDGSLQSRLHRAQWLRDLSRELYRPPHAPPLISRLPFSYRWVPPRLRFGLARYLTTRALASNRARGAFPGFWLNCHPAALSFLSDDKPRQSRLVLSHDFENAGNFPIALEVAALEEEFGYSSSWNVVPKAYEIDHKVLKDLQRRGHEIGLHGIHHDCREAFMPEAILRGELAALGAFFSEYNIRGYRGPSWMRTPRMFEALAEFFTYDLTCLDVDFICPAGFGGVGTTQAFRHESGLVEIPCTIPFEAPVYLGIAPCDLVRSWKTKLNFLARTGSDIVINTHPDPNYIGSPPMMRAYRELLKYLRDQGFESILPGTLAERFGQA